MFPDEKNPQTSHSYQKLHQHNPISYQQIIKTTINTLITKLKHPKIQWKNISPDIQQLNKYFNNHQDHQAIQQMSVLLKLIVMKYDQSGGVEWLELFEDTLLFFQNKLDIQAYRSFILIITSKLFKKTLQICSKDNANIKKQVLKQPKQQTQQTLVEDNMQLHSEQKLIQKISNMHIEGQSNGKKQVCRQWKIYIDILKSYAYQCVVHKKIKDVWIFYDFVMMFALNCDIFETNIQIFGEQVGHIITKMKEIASGRYLQCIYHDFFHEICLFLRIYISTIKQFLQNNSKIIKPNQKVPLTNNCSLIMRFIQRQFTDQNISLTKQHKLDCLMLLTSIASLKLPKSANYNQVLQFSLQIVLYIHDEEQETCKNISNKSSISELMFYCGQLLSLIMHTNIDWVIQFCKKDPQNADKKYLRKVLRIYKKGLLHLNDNLLNQPHELYVYIRYILGFCGLMKIEKMDSYVQDTIRDNFIQVVRIMEVIHGWEEQHDEQQEYKAQKNNQAEEKQEQQYHKQEFMQQFLEKSNQSEPQRRKQYILWSEQFYNKNNLVCMQDIDQIDIFKKSMIAVKMHNPPLFEQLLNNFTEKQIMMWVVELEHEQDQDDIY